VGDSAHLAPPTGTLGRGHAESVSAMQEPTKDSCISEVLRHLCPFEAFGSLNRIFKMQNWLSAEKMFGVVSVSKLLRGKSSGKRCKTWTRNLASLLVAVGHVVDNSGG